MACGYLTFAACHLALTAAVVAVGRALQRAIGRGSEARRAHGRYVLGWAVAGFAAGPPAAVVAFSERPPAGVAPAVMVSYVIGMFSMLAGWAVGMVYGGLVPAWRSARYGSSVGAAKPTPAGELGRCQSDGSRLAAGGGPAEN